MAIMVMMASSPRVMGRLTAPRSMVVVGWLAVLIMALATIGFLVL
jgi:Mn2+/Fe2+ NRAMP family transporter